MDQTMLLTKFEKGLRVLAGLALGLTLFQCMGVVIYVMKAWPPPGGVPVLAITVLVAGAVAAGLARSCLWIWIYWRGAEVLSVLRRRGDAFACSEELAERLRGLTRLFITSCLLDVLFLPAVFLMDRFLEFQATGVQLGLIDLGLLSFPQAFGLAALVLAYLTHNYGKLLGEHSRMKRELELTI